MKKSTFYKVAENGKVICLLCPHYCSIAEGKYGICRIRKNINSELYLETYGKISAIHFDPIEKKPLYHFYPGSTILSIGGIGCSFRCKFCQNWEIAQSSPSEFTGFKEYSVDKLIEQAFSKNDNIGIAYTYNEPFVWYEYMLDIAKEASTKGLKNAIVSNGYVNQPALEEIIPFMDAFNVDLKAFTSEFYKKMVAAKIEIVKENLKYIKSKGKHLEITNLVIPGLNDEEKTFSEMCLWIANELGNDTVLHISRYFPRFKLDIKSTPVSKLLDLFHIAKSHLKHVYLGNVATGEGRDTICDKCGNILINRKGYYSDLLGLTDKGNCRNCGENVILNI